MQMTGFPPKRPATNWPLWPGAVEQAKWGNLAVGDDVLVLDHLGNAAQAGAQNHGHLGPEPSQLGLQSVRAFPILGKGIIHSISSISGPRPCFSLAPGQGFRQVYWDILHPLHGKIK